MVLSPMQDHVRRMLHISSLSWKAATVSVVQFVVVAAAIAVGLAVDIPEAWMPFGALAFANAISLAYARVLAQFSVREQTGGTLKFTELASTGVWYVINAAPAVVWFAVAAIIAWLASPEDLGFAESARVVAQPILVFTTGLTAVLTPRAMRAAMDVDLAAARKTRVTYLGSMAIAGIAYVGVAGWDWALNPMAHIVPSAYELSGLAAFTILANMATSAAFLQSDELAGARKERLLAAISWLSSVFVLLGGATASFTGAFARPLAGIGGGAARYAAQARALLAVYRAPNSDPDHES